MNATAAVEPATTSQPRRLHQVGDERAEITISYLPQHLEWMRKCGRSERTITARREVMTKLAETLGHDPVTADLLELEAWQTTLPSPNMTSWCTTIIRPYFKYLRDRGIRQDNPAALLPKPPDRHRLPRPISEDSLARAIREAPPRLLPWLLLAGWCGLRAIEISRLRRDSFWLDARGQRWVSVLGKGDKERNVPVPAWLWARIEPGLPTSGPCWLVGSGPMRGQQVTARHVSQYCNEYMHEKLGIPDTFHSLRHRVATMALENTNNLRLVQDLLGHASLAHLQVYTRVASGSVANAVGALPEPEA